MSQKKVDEYKNYKKNRRENIKKEKRLARRLGAGKESRLRLWITPDGA